MDTDQEYRWAQIGEHKNVGTVRGLAWVNFRDRLMWVQIRDRDRYRSEDIGKYGYRSGMSWVHIRECVQIRDRVQIMVLHMYMHDTMGDEESL